MRPITIDEIKRAFELGIQAYDTDVSSSSLKQTLVDEFGMTPSSALGYIETVSNLLDGKCYTRTINAQATEYYLEQIHQRYDITTLKSAVEAVRKHADYYQSKSGSNPKATRTIYEKYACICEQHFEYDDLERAIDIAKSDSSEERRFRLKSAPTKAALIDSRANLYRRNPDVVAERLFIADGVCENCEKPAPFLRKKDNTPYLEVHHIIHLADDGPDCLENTEALCPNCHRERHYG